MQGPLKREKPRRIARIQVIAVAILAVGGVINYVDRGSLAIANTTIRGELGMSATRMGVLLSVFSMAYAVSQLPVGILLDKFGERLVMGAGMLLWSVTQALTGSVRGFASFFAARVGLAVGEAPFVISSVKVVHDWFDVRERATPMAVINASTTLGQAVAPPILTGIMLAFGWRGMFMAIGAPGVLLALVWFGCYRDRTAAVLSEGERGYLAGSSESRKGPGVSLRQWLGLFRQRSMWGMMLGFGGINYTVWLYMSWMPNYLQAEHHLTLAATGMFAVIPFSCGAVGMMASGVIADWLVRRGVAPVGSYRTLLVTGLTCSGLCTLLVPYLTGATGAALGMGMALFFTYLAGNAGWCLVQALAPAGVVGSVAAIQNFGSFVCASFAPVVTGWLLDRTHSFHLALVICAMVSVLGAVSYLVVVREPIRVG